MELLNKKIDKLKDGYYLFSSANCPACEKLKNSLHELDGDESVIELDAYEYQAIAMELGLMGTPCLVEMRDNREYDRMYGAANEQRLSAFFKGE